MGKTGETLLGIGSLIVGIAALSVILSRNSATANIIQAAASGFSNVLGVAISPSSGQAVQTDLSYPGSQGN
jgi:hypothetical protein